MDKNIKGLGIEEIIEEIKRRNDLVGNSGNSFVQNELIKNIKNYVVVLENQNVMNIVKQIRKDADQDLAKSKNFFYPFIKEFSEKIDDLLKIANKIGVEEKGYIALRDDSIDGPVKKLWVISDLQTQLKFISDGRMYSNTTPDIYEKLIRSYFFKYRRFLDTVYSLALKEKLDVMKLFAPRHLLISKPEKFEKIDEKQIVLNYIYFTSQAGFVSATIGLKPWWQYYCISKVGLGLLTINEAVPIFDTNDNLPPPFNKLLFINYQYGSIKWKLSQADQNTVKQTVGRLSDYLIENLKGVKKQDSQANEEEYISRSGLTYWSKKGILRYVDGPLTEINPGDRAIKFLSLLMVRKDIVTHEEIALTIKFNDAEDKSQLPFRLTDEIKYIKRDLKKVLVDQARMSPDDFRYLIRSVRLQGYCFRDK